MAKLVVFFVNLRLVIIVGNATVFLAVLNRLR